MTSHFPRLLVATEFPPNSPGGGPAVVRQMLRDWPVDQLFWWSCLPETDQKAGQRVAAHAVAAIPQKLYPHRRWCAQKSWLLEHLWAPWAARHLKQTLQNIQPEVVWAIPHNWSVPPLTRTLPAAATAFHVTVQDYTDNQSSVDRFGAGCCGKLARQAETLYAAADTRDTTSHPMTADLLARTGHNAAQMLHAGLEETDLEYLKTLVPAPGGHIRIAYAGTIMVEKEFAFFVSALKAIRARLPQPVSLEFFGNHTYRSRPWFEPDWMNEHGNLPAAALTEALRQCTWGFSPMALDDNDPRYNRFSFPTKFISYLGAGLPVITLGHPESSVIKMASAYDVGLCFKSGDAAAFSSELLAVLSAPNPAVKFHAGIRQCATVEFDAVRMRSILYGCFRQCAEMTRQRKQR